MYYSRYGLNKGVAAGAAAAAAAVVVVVVVVVSFSTWGLEVQFM